MIADFFNNIAYRVFAALPILAIPDGFNEALHLFSSLVGYINVFVPVLRIAPILGLVVMIRNFNIVVAIFRFILRFIPFMGG